MTEQTSNALAEAARRLREATERAASALRAFNDAHERHMASRRRPPRRYGPTDVGR